MKYYKDKNNQVFAYESDGSQDDYINPNLARMTDTDVELHINPPKNPAPIPTTVTIKQARLALLEFGLLDNVNAAIAMGSEIEKITWEFASNVIRTDPLVVKLSIALGLNEKLLDSIFLLASTL